MTTATTTVTMKMMNMMVVVIMMMSIMMVVGVVVINMNMKAEKEATCLQTVLDRSVSFKMNDGGVISFQLKRRFYSNNYFKVSMNSNVRPKTKCKKCRPVSPI